MVFCARQHFVSPPAVSQQISLLEKEFDATLFIRSAQGMELTPAGQIVYNCCLARLVSLDTAKQRIGNLQAIQQVPSIRLGLREGWALPRQMMHLRQLLHNTIGNVNLDIHCLNLHAGISALGAGKLDAFICLSGDREVLNFPNELSFCPISRVERIFLFSALCPMAKKPPYSPVDFADIPLLCLSEFYQTHAQFDNVSCCNQLGFNPSSIIQKESLDNALFAVSMGDGYFIGDKWLYTVRAPAFSHLPLGMYHTVHMLWMEQNPNPLLPQLVKLCTTELNWNPKEEPAA